MFCPSKQNTYERHFYFAVKRHNTKLSLRCHGEAIYEDVFNFCAQLHRRTRHDDILDGKLKMSPYNQISYAKNLPCHITVNYKSIHIIALRNLIFHGQKSFVSATPYIRPIMRIIGSFFLSLSLSLSHTKPENVLDTLYRKLHNTSGYSYQVYATYTIINYYHI